MSLDDVITTADICEQYGVTRQAVAAWRAAGLPSKAVGSGHVYIREEVEAWLEQKNR